MGNQESYRDRIVTTVMRRKYEKLGVTLPHKYWNLPEYKPEYRQQMIMASKFMKAYDIDAILNVLNKETWCFSLYAKQLPELIELEQSRLKKQKIQEKLQQESRPVVKPAPNVPLFRKKKDE